MKVAELEGALLAYWVARALGFPSADAVPVEQCGWEQIEDESFRKDWAPHEDWEQGGPIIEREQIGMFPTRGLAVGLEWRASANRFVMSQIYGPTPLIAAMRAYVAEKFGDEVSDDTKQLDSVQTQL